MSHAAAFVRSEGEGDVGLAAGIGLPGREILTDVGKILVLARQRGDQELRDVKTARIAVNRVPSGVALGLRDRRLHVVALEERHAHLEVAKLRHGLHLAAVFDETVGSCGDQDGKHRHDGDDDHQFDEREAGSESFRVGFHDSDS